MGYYWKPGMLAFEKRNQPLIGGYEVDQSIFNNEDPRWLQVESVEVSPGVFEDQATVNVALKATIQQQDLDDDLARQAEKAAKDAAKDAIKAKADKTKNRKIDTLEEIKSELQNIYDILDYILKN